jgi:hypothetical protein
MPLWPWKKPKPSRADTSRELRERALSLTPSELNLAPTAELPNVFGILMETAYPEAVASLVAFAEGSTSLYFSSGGGIIGAGEHESVRAALVPFFRTAESHLHAFTRSDSTPLPKPGRVRFYVRTFERTLTAEADEQDLGEMRHPLSPLFHAGHNVIGAVREATPG